MQCVILAGGLGTRMFPETRTIPKTLLPVGGKPFAAWQLSWLARSGIDEVVYSVGHLGQQVRDYVGDGSAWGLAVHYVDEGDQLRGTAGALRLAFDEGVLADDFLVLNGDSWLQIDPAEVLRVARGRPEPALMTVFRNEGRWDASNVVLEGARVARYEKGLADLPPEMRWIDYGLLAFRSEVIRDRVPPGGPHDLAPLCTALARDGLLAALEAGQRFYEIGSLTGRAELQAKLAAEAAGSASHSR
ncbi:MAG TPA: sugar phosphate nucleotidyltransferase [Streptosporangiaceae bacterium]|nr:sugar phosphate nucleotidyltransferase [Streptosporangiaceae bacterium]